MKYNIIYKNNNYTNTFHKKTTLLDIKLFIIKSISYFNNTNIHDIKLWNDGNTPLLKDEFTMYDYNLYYDNINIYVDIEYPTIVNELYQKYYKLIK